jgi:hypothetical protein
VTRDAPHGQITDRPVPEPARKQGDEKGDSTFVPRAKNLGVKVRIRNKSANSDKRFQRRWDDGMFHGSKAGKEALHPSRWEKHSRCAMMLRRSEPEPPRPREIEVNGK